MSVVALLILLCVVLVVKSEEWLFIYLFYFYCLGFWVFGLNEGMWMTEHRRKRLFLGA
jgi:hypothetical protein